METTTEKEVIKKLPLEFYKAGLHWKQVKRTSTIALYCGYVTTGGLKDKPVEWEIIKVRVRNAHTIFKNTPIETYIPTHEVYPKTSEWGTYGFTHNNEQRAMNKYQSLLN